MITTIEGKEVELTKADLMAFAYMEYDSLSKNDLIELLVELDVNSGSFEECYMEMFNDYSEEDRKIILGKIRSNKTES